MYPRISNTPAVWYHISIQKAKPSPTKKKYTGYDTKLRLIVIVLVLEIFEGCNTSSLTLLQGPAVIQIDMLKIFVFNRNTWYYITKLFCSKNMYLD